MIFKTIFHFRFILLTLLSLITINTAIAASPPDFRQFTSLKARNEAFVNFMLPQANAANNSVLKTRTRILALEKIWRIDKKLSAEDIEWLNTIATNYKLASFDYKKPKDWQLLLKHVDIIPNSLLLAQAANESAWGTSRFAREGLNYFGLWCHKPGCGLIPLKRSASATHEVQAFPTPLESTLAYINFLNTHPAFDKLRESRKQLRQTNSIIKGEVLAHGLKPYSQLGSDYVNIIRDLIQRYEFWRHDLGHL